MSQSYLFKIAGNSRDIEAYFSLRHRVFVEEQGVFDQSDVDDIDGYAYPMVAVESRSNSVVGVVRIYESEPGIWYGGRLATHRDHRRGWHIGKGLIYQAVTTANSLGCDRFFAQVQIQNVRFFQRLHWTSLEEISLHNHLHHLMEADLNFYPPAEALYPSREEVRKVC